MALTHIDKDGRTWYFDPEYGWTCADMFENVRKYMATLTPNKTIGTIFIIGTGGEINDNKKLKELFYNPEGYDDKLLTARPREYWTREHKGTDTGSTETT